MDEMDEILGAFIEDGRDHLDAMEAGLLQLEAGDVDAETMNRIFRAAHTIKGDAGVVGLAHVEQFAHHLEDYLSQIRKGELAASRPLVTLLLRGCDHIKRQFSEILAGRLEANAELQTAGDQLQQQLHTLVHGSPAAQASNDTALVVATPASKEIALADCWQICVYFDRDMFRERMDPRDFLTHLFSKGELVRIDTLTDRLPAADALDAESCYLGFEVFLFSEQSKADIEGAFEFVRDQCELTVLPPASKVDDYIQSIEELPEETMPLGQMLMQSAAITPDDLAQGLAQLERKQRTKSAGSAPHHLGQILVEQHLIQPEIVEAAANKQQQVSAKKADEARQIRVSTEKLDQLVDLVGEMVVSSAVATHLSQDTGRSDLVEANSGLARLIERMRELSLQLRMVQIGDTFNRFRRVVRDIAREMNREIELVITGAETELDKSVVEKIGDPLTHLIRNAIDHGIEPAAVRRANGKPVAGRIELNAYHETGGIVIEVADDGGGLDKDKILAKARERGLVSDTQLLSDQEIYDLIFVAGFSTADKVTNLSGRGVGMDVVRANISALRGTVEVQTEPGRGTRFVIRLPLTMAIIDGFLVGVGKSSYVIPLETVLECTEFEDTGIDRDYINLRGELLSFVRLRELFSLSGPRPTRENVVVVRAGKKKVGIIVDRLLGEFQTVIKPLSSVFQHLKGIAGSTILGTGGVALIIDVPALAKLVCQLESDMHEHATQKVA